LPEIVEPDLLIELDTITAIWSGTEPGGFELLPGSVTHVSPHFAGLCGMLLAKPLKLAGAVRPLSELSVLHCAPQKVTLVPIAEFRSPITNDPLARCGTPALGVGVGVAVAVGVGVTVGVGVPVCVKVAVGVGVPVGVEVAVGVAVELGIGVGPSTLKPFESLDPLYCDVPAKFALSVIMPVLVGVTWQAALPLELVVPEQIAPPSVKFTFWPEIAATGASDVSVRFAVRVTC
jgi:hypothetical protein